jgi:hypothetical protein
MHTYVFRSWREYLQPSGHPRCRTQRTFLEFIEMGSRGSSDEIAQSNTIDSPKNALPSLGRVCWGRSVRNQLEFARFACSSESIKLLGAPCITAKRSCPAVSVGNFIKRQPSIQFCKPASCTQASNAVATSGSDDAVVVNTFVFTKTLRVVGGS